MIYTIKLDFDSGDTADVAQNSLSWNIFCCRYGRKKAFLLYVFVHDDIHSS